jgi:hypothetical protein
MPSQSSTIITAFDTYHRFTHCLYNHPVSSKPSTISLSMLSAGSLTPYFTTHRPVSHCYYNSLSTPSKGLLAFYSTIQNQSAFYHYTSISVPCIGSLTDYFTTQYPVNHLTQLQLIDTKRRITYSLFHHSISSQQSINAIVYYTRQKITYKLFRHGVQVSNTIITACQYNSQG